MHPRGVLALARPSGLEARRFGLAAAASLVVLLVAPSPSRGLLGDAVHVTSDNLLTIGAALRIERRDPDLIGKANLHPELCAPDDCLGTRASDTEPDERFLAARGAMSSNTDDGNLNYDRGDVTALVGKWTTRWQIDWRGYRLELGGVALFDPVNLGFDERHPNRIVRPGPGPGEPVRVERPDEVERGLGYDLELREASLRKRVDVLGQEVALEIGRQRFGWGEATFATRGTLDVVNPPNTNRLAVPGVELSEIFKPVGMIAARTTFAPGWSLEAFYPVEWRPVTFPARGSFLSFFDAGNEVAPGDHASAPFSKSPEDPDQLQTPANAFLAQISATSFALRRDENQEPGPVGEFGLAVRGSLPRLGPRGARFGLHFARYHSRIPSVSARASTASCTRREGNSRGEDTMTAIDFQIDCGVPGVNRPGEDFEALPIDTARYFLDYPEGILLFGGSFHLEALGTYWQGELAFRPNDPIQVDLEDVLFAAMQPAFPRHTIELGMGTLPNSRRAIPDFVTEYRGGDPGEIPPGQTVRGFERFETLQLTAGATRLRSNRLFGLAVESALLLETGMIWIPRRPPLDELQLEGPGTHTHAGPGVADTGDGLKVNPTRNRGGYVTEISWGYRTGLLLTHRNATIPGLQLRSVLVWSHDVRGVSPGLAENFLEGRKLAIGSLEARYRSWAVAVGVMTFFGGGDRNLLHDRDFVTLSLQYRL